MTRPTRSFRGKLTTSVLVVSSATFHRWATPQALLRRLRDPREQLLLVVRSSSPHRAAAEPLDRGYGGVCPGEEVRGGAAVVRIGGHPAAHRDLRAVAEVQERRRH